MVTWQVTAARPESVRYWNDVAAEITAENWGALYERDQLRDHELTARDGECPLELPPHLVDRVVCANRLVIAQAARKEQLLELLAREQRRARLVAHGRGKALFPGMTRTVSLDQRWQWHSHRR